MRLFLMSNGTMPGKQYLEHALSTLESVCAGFRTVAFIPYAQYPYDAYTVRVREAIIPLGLKLLSVHEGSSPSDVIEQSDAIFVGGGNSFRLLSALYAQELIPLIQSKVQSGTPYIGASAGTNIACPTIRTTNDMPIVQPPSLASLNLIPFQINPHYPVAEYMAHHQGESRDMRLEEFLDDNAVPVLAMQEGSWLDIHEKTVTFDGASSARLFQRNGITDVHPGVDISFLMEGAYAFDSRRAEP